MHILFRYYVVLIIIFLSFNVKGAKDTLISDSTKISKSAFLAYPIAFYFPETRFGFGVAGIYSFRFKNESLKTNPSQVIFTIDYTMNRQLILVMPFELYWKNQLWKARGEIGYNRYFYNFYGIGSTSNIFDRETYDVNFPRVQLDLLRSYKRVFFGFRSGFDDYRIVRLTPDGILDNSIKIGKEGGRSIGLGLLLQFDSRDYLQSPSKGFFGELNILNNTKRLGSNFNFWRIAMNISNYTSLKEDFIIASNLIITHTSEGTPFFEMPYFGSPSRARGFQDRRFTDKNMYVFQSEFRYPIYKRLQGVAFGSISAVTPNFGKIIHEDMKGAGGMGLRFQLSKNFRTKIRLDYGVTKEILIENEPSKWKSAMYITVNDAF